MPMPLTYLFVPGTRPERFAKAIAAGAGAVILDLEDAVAPVDKAQARANVCAWLLANPAPTTRIFVRINDAATPWYTDDLAALRIVKSVAFGLMLPKCESVAQIAHCLTAINSNSQSDAPLISIIESARGVQQVDAIAQAPSLLALAFGTLDYAVDLDLPLANDTPAKALEYAAARIAIASRAAGLPAPIAGVTPELDTARVAADMQWARGFGFGSKLCIHPMQVSAVHAALTPSEAQLQWARRVLAATAGRSTAVQLDGRMVDKPVVLQAQAVLARVLPDQPIPSSS